MAKNEKKTEIKKVVAKTPAKAPAPKAAPAEQFAGRIAMNQAVIDSLASVLVGIKATELPSRSLKFAATRVQEAKQLLEREMKGLKLAHEKAKAKAKAEKAVPADAKTDEKKSEE